MRCSTPTWTKPTSRSCWTGTAPKHNEAASNPLSPSPPPSTNNKPGILATVRLCINNTHHERLNRRVHLIINQAYGFHSTRATPALNMITPGPINHVLPHKQEPDPQQRPTSIPGGPEKG